MAAMEPATKTTPGEQPESVAPTGEQPSTPDPQANPLEGASDAELLMALEESEPGTSDPQEAPATQAEPAPAPEPEATPEPTPEETTGEETTPKAEGTESPAEPTGTEEQPTPSAGAIKRLSVKGLESDEQKQLADAVSMVRKGEADSIPDAYAKMGVSTASPTEPTEPTGEEPTPTGETPAKAEAETPQSPPVEGSVASIKSDIQSLREQRRKAVEDFDTSEQARLTEEIEDKLLALSDAKEDQAKAERSAETYETEYDASLDRVETKYPEAADESTPFYRVLDDRVARMHSTGDPRVKDPKFIEAIAEEVAADLGKSPHVAPKPESPVAKRPVGSGLVPGSSTAAKPSEEDARRWVHEAPIEELEEALLDH